MLEVGDPTRCRRVLFRRERLVIGRVMDDSLASLPVRVATPDRLRRSVAVTNPSRRHLRWHPGRAEPRRDPGLAEPTSPAVWTAGACTPKRTASVIRGGPWPGEGKPLWAAAPYHRARIPVGRQVGQGFPLWLSYPCSFEAGSGSRVLVAFFDFRW